MMQALPLIVRGATQRPIWKWVCRHWPRSKVVRQSALRSLYSLFTCAKGGVAWLIRLSGCPLTVLRSTAVANSRAATSPSSVPLAVISPRPVPVKRPAASKVRG